MCGMQKYIADGDDLDVSGVLLLVLWDVIFLRRYVYSGVVKIVFEIVSMIVMIESFMLLFLFFLDVIDLYFIREGGFRFVVQFFLKLVKRKVFKSVGFMFVILFDDLVMFGGCMELEEVEISVVFELEIVEIGKNLGKEFWVLCNFCENEMLRKQFRKVIVCFEFYKFYLVSKFSRKSSKVNKVLKFIFIIFKK